MQTAKRSMIGIFSVLLLICFCAPSSGNSIVDGRGITWQVSAECNPSVGEGLDIRLLNTTGEPEYDFFITFDETLDADPHIFLSNTDGVFGVVWSRFDASRNNRRIFIRYVEPDSGWLSLPSPLTTPEAGVDHITPQMVMSPSGISHLVFVEAKTVVDHIYSSVIYYNSADGGWSSRNPFVTVSEESENAVKPELLMGTSTEGYPLLLTYISTPYFGQMGDPLEGDGISIKILQRDNGTPDPWDNVQNQALPINPASGSGLTNIE